MSNTVIKAELDNVIPWLMSHGLTRSESSKFLVKVLKDDDNDGVKFTHGLVEYTMYYCNPLDGPDYFNVVLNNLVA